MHKYNKIRGILRAKQGSQVPKYQYGGPGGMMYDGYNNRLDSMLYSHLTNPYNTGSLQPSSLLIPSISNQLGSNPIGDQTQANITAAHNYINNNIDANGNLNAMQEPTTLDQLKQANPNAFQWNLPTTIPDSAKIKPTFGQKLKIVGKGLGKKAINFASENQGLVTSGINTAMNSIDNTKNSSTFNIVSGGLQTASKIPGVVGLAATGANALLRGINKFTSKTIDIHTMSEQEKSKAGNYEGMLALNNKVSNLEGVEFGGIGGGSEYREGVRNNNELLRQLNIWRGISNTADDQLAMAGNDIYQLGYEMQQNGGYPTQFLRASKQGGTLTQKINIVKSRKFNQVINVDTKQVEEFKEGGKLEISEWEPVIELFEEWEPEIVLEVEEFKDGGKTKEELETPEIEETSQKNLIPEGALHKNKHHMEHTEGLTQKGIPVIDNDGEQQAEIELDEIIFTLEVTKKLEELYKEGTDEAAIEAGKLLVKEILFNTDDRTGLISKCEKGGKICQIEE